LTEGAVLERERYPDERTGELKRLAHDVKNALNGVSVNLEVARSRATRGISDPAQLAPFLESAAQQLETAAKLHKQFADLAVALALHASHP
jgi:hypothetical protein